MTPAEQEKLFSTVFYYYPHESIKWVSGYVHGVMDHGLHRPPNSRYLHEYRNNRDPYANGYFIGYTDSIADDIVPVKNA